MPVHSYPKGRVTVRRPFAQTDTCFSGADVPGKHVEQDPSAPTSHAEKIAALFLNNHLK
jgi:hypothetical protein